MTPLDRRQNAQTLLVVSLNAALIFSAGYALAAFGLLEAAIVVICIVLVIGGIVTAISRSNGP